LPPRSGELGKNHILCNVRVLSSIASLAPLVAWLHWLRPLRPNISSLHYYLFFLNHLCHTLDLVLCVDFVLSAGLIAASPHGFLTNWYREPSILWVFFSRH
jgi:hypothetical protein